MTDEAKPVVAHFNYERSTAKKHVFREDGSDFIRMIYLRNDKYEELGKPQRIKVTVEGETS